MLMPRLCRRQMLRTFANGFGMLGLAGLLADDALARAPPPPQPAVAQAAAVRRQGPSGSSSCSCPAGRRTWTCSTPSRGWRDYAASRCRSSSRSSCGPNRATVLPSPWKFAKHGQCGTEVSELLPHIAELRRRHVRHPLDGGRQHQPQRRLPADEHRRAGVLPAQPGLVAAVRPGQREPEPARLRGHQPVAAGPGRAALEQQLPARRLPGDAGQRPEEPDRQPEKPVASACRASASSSTC